MRAEAATAVVSARPTADGIEATFRFPGTAPIFAGHFPGDPIVPGVLLVAATLAAVEAVCGGRPELVAVHDAKFNAPIRPDRDCTASIILSEEPSGARCCDARWRIEGTAAARLRLAFR